MASPFRGLGINQLHRILHTQLFTAEASDACFAISEVEHDLDQLRLILDWTAHLVSVLDARHAASQAALATGYVAPSASAAAEEVADDDDDT